MTFQLFTVLASLNTTQTIVLLQFGIPILLIIWAKLPDDLPRQDVKAMRIIRFVLGAVFVGYLQHMYTLYTTAKVGIAPAVVFLRGRIEEAMRDGDPEEFHTTMYDDETDVRRAKVRPAREGDKDFRKKFDTLQEFADNEPELFQEVTAPSPTVSLPQSPASPVPNVTETHTADNVIQEAIETLEQLPPRPVSPVVPSVEVSEQASVPPVTHTHTVPSVEVSEQASVPTLTEHERQRRLRARKYAPGAYPPRVSHVPPVTPQTDVTLVTGIPHPMWRTPPPVPIGGISLIHHTPRIPTVPTAPDVRVSEHTQTRTRQQAIDDYRAMRERARQHIGTPAHFPDLPDSVDSRGIQGNTETKRTDGEPVIPVDNFIPSVPVPLYIQAQVDRDESLTRRLAYAPRTHTHLQIREELLDDTYAYEDILSVTQVPLDSVPHVHVPTVPHVPHVHGTQAHTVPTVPRVPNMTQAHVVVPPPNMSPTVTRPAVHDTRVPPDSVPDVTRPDVTQTQAQTAADIFAGIYTEARLQHDAYDNPATDPTEITQEPFRTTLTRISRPVFRLNRDMDTLDIARLETYIGDEGFRWIDLLEHIRGVMRSQDTDTHHNHQLRAVIRYESGKTDVHHTLEEWETTIVKWLNRYTEEDEYTGPIPVSITVELCNAWDRHVLRDLGYRVRASHGFPSMIPGTDLVRMDLFRTNGTCATAAYFIWCSLTMFSSTHRQTLAHMWQSPDDMFSAYKTFKDRCKQADIGRQWCTDDLRQIAPHATLRQYLEKDESHMSELSALSDGDFLNGNTCHLLISKSAHASILWPMHLLPDYLRAHVRYKMVRTYDRRIVAKPLRSTLYTDINTLHVSHVVHSNGTLMIRSVRWLHRGTIHSCNTAEEFVQWALSVDAPIQLWCHGDTPILMLNYAVLHSCNRYLTHPLDPLNNSHESIEHEYHLINRHILRLRNSRLHLPQALDKLGKSYLLHVPEDPLVLLHDVLDAHQRTSLQMHDVNPLRYVTVSAYSMAVALSHIGPDTELYSLAPSVDDRLRRGYKVHGAQVFHRGRIKGKMYMLDFNSHFPAMMCQDLPYGTPIHHSSLSHVTQDKMEQWLQRHRGFYDIRVTHAPGIKFPLFMSPTVNKSDTETHDMVETDQILYALSLGYQLELIQGYEFSYAPYLRDWVHDMYKHKEHAVNDAHRTIAKLTLNTPYGSFGTKWRNRQQYVTYGTSYIPQMRNNELLGVSDGVIINDIWCGTETTDMVFRHVNVSISSCVTSRAWVHLHKNMMRVSSLGSDILYVDTDSMLVTDSPGVLDGTHPTALGALKVVAEIKEATIVGPRAYTYTSTDDIITTRMSSVSVSSVTDTTQLINSAADGHSPMYTQVRLYRPSHSHFTPTPLIQRVLNYAVSRVSPM